MSNFHTHTYRCKHATGDVIDYAREAFALGGHVLGITDHVALPDNRWPDVRMAFAELDSYERAIETARVAMPQMTILKGMECEYAKQYHHYFQDELLGKRQYDYLIGACHYIPMNGEWRDAFEELNTPAALVAYTNYLIKMMATGLFAFIAHPDLFGYSNEHWNADLEICSRDIIQAAEATKTPLEINGNGFRKTPKFTSAKKRAAYPWEPFWELATDYNIQVICNSDAHHPKQVFANINDTRHIANVYHLDIIDLSESLFIKKPL